MKKLSLLASAAALAATLPLSAQDAPPAVPEDAIAPKDSAPAFEVSTRIGARSLNKTDFWETGPGAQVELRVPLGNSPLDITARGYYAVLEKKKGASDNVFAYYSNGRADVWVEADDGDATYYGGNVQLQLNFDRGAMLNPYIAAGCVYEKEKIDLECRIYGRDSRYFYDLGSAKFKFSDDGTAFVGRVGMEFNFDKVWLLAECGWMSESYDDSDDAQATIVGRAGWYFSKNCRLDVGVDYYVEWEDLCVSAGVGFLL